jgi:two-component system nitrate/nitrite sensor histidine kinase NarX
MILTLPIQVWLPILIIAFAGTIYFSILYRNQKNQRRQLEQLETQLDHSNNRLNTVLQLNQKLAEAMDEKSLVEAALAAVNRLVGGLGVSYVPLDTWGQPLPAYTFGELPDPVLKGWAEHLVSESTRSRCSQCQELQSLPGQSCPLKTHPFGEAMSIYCLPLSLGDRGLGMVNIYLPPNRTIDTELHHFLAGLLY